MSGLVVGLIVITVLFFVMEPFFGLRKLPNRFVTKKQMRKKILQARRDETAQSIRDLDLDSATAKIPKEDYVKLREAYLARLGSIAQELDGLSGLNGTGNIKQRIEDEVKTRRRTDAVPVPELQTVVCPKCSTENLPGSKFCSECGSHLLT